MRSIEKIWYSRFSWQAALLLPQRAFFVLVAAVRRNAFHYRRFPIKPFACAVVVVGNLTAGGAGKTPLTLYLAQALALRGKKDPGSFPDGYRGSVVAPLPDYG